MFNQDRDHLLKCIDEYNQFDEEMDQQGKDCKTINNFLCELPEGSHTILELYDLEKLQKNEHIKF
jgi:hypothetical protein